MTLSKSGATIGAPTKYKPEYDKKIVSFFQSFIDNIRGKDPEQLKKKIQDFPDWDSFCESVSPGNITFSSETLDEWTKHYSSFQLAYKRAERLRRRYLILCGNSGVYHPIFCMFTAKNEVGMRDQVDITSGGKTITPTFIAHDNGLRRSKPSTDKKP